MLIAFNAAPGTVGVEGTAAYGAYAMALSEMIKEGGLALNDVFERVRLRVNDLTSGSELPWNASRIEVSFVLFENGRPALRKRRPKILPICEPSPFPRWIPKMRISPLWLATTSAAIKNF